MTLELSSAAPIRHMGVEFYEPGGGTVDPALSHGIVDFAGGGGTAMKSGGVAGGEDKSWNDDGFTFGDFLDIINPLQHLPVISSIYRWLTGDEIAPAARVAGGTLYGGPIGLAVALIDNAIESETGRNIGEHIIAGLTGEDDGGNANASAVAVAAKQSGSKVAAAVLAPGPEIAPPLRAVPVQAVLAKALPAQLALGGGPVPASPVKAAPVAIPGWTRPKQMEAALAAQKSHPVSLSPQAFEALMRSIGAQPVTQAQTKVRAPAQVLKAPEAAAELPAVKRRAAAMELHRLLADRAASGTVVGGR